MKTDTRIIELEKELDLKNKQIKSLKDQLGKDDLTGLYKWHSKIGQEILLDKILSAGRQELTVWLCLADVDYLKIINDKFGMDKGDIVIRIVGESISKSLRGLNNTFKYGADEFPFFLSIKNNNDLVIIFNRIYEKFLSLLAESNMSQEITQMLSFSCTVSPIKVVKKYAFGGLAFENVHETFGRIDKLMHEKAKKLNGKVSFYIEGSKDPIVFGEKFDLSNIIASNSEYAKRYLN